VQDLRRHPSYVVVLPERSEYQTSQILETIKKGVARRAINFLKRKGSPWLQAPERKFPPLVFTTGASRATDDVRGRRETKEVIDMKVRSDLHAGGFPFTG
jgi:hypothetical protein